MDFVRPVAHLVITTTIVVNGEMRMVDTRTPVLDDSGLRTVETSEVAGHEPVEEQQLPPFPPGVDVMFSFEGFSWTAPKMTRVRRTYCDNRPEKIEVFAGDELLFTLDFTYDEKGRRSKISQTAARGVFKEEHAFLVDAVMEHLRGLPITVIEFEYDDKDRVAEERHEMMGQVTDVRRFKYRDDGLLESESMYSEPGDHASEARCEYEFNKEGDWIVQTVLQRKGDKFTPVTIVKREIVYR